MAHVCAPANGIVMGILGSGVRGNGYDWDLPGNSQKPNFVAAGAIVENERREAGKKLLMKTVRQ